MTIEQERLTPTQEEIERLEDLLANCAPHPKSWFVDVDRPWVVGPAVAEFFGPACGAPNAALVVAAINTLPALLAALKSPPIGGEGEVGDLADRSPAQFFFEVGFGACWAEAFIKNAGTPPFPLTDAAVERAWSIAGEAHDDPAEFDRYLALASSTEGERTEALCDAYNAGACDAAPGYAAMAEPTASGDVGKLCEQDALRGKLGEILTMAFDVEGDDPRVENAVVAILTRMEAREQAMREALKVAEQALLEVHGAQIRGEDWYTQGRSGLYQQVAMWVAKGRAAISAALTLDAVSDKPE